MGFGVYRFAEGQQAGTAPAHVHGEGNRPFIVANARRPIYRTVVALLAATGVRIAELLALEIGKHISPDCTVIYIRQQRSR